MHQIDGRTSARCVPAAVGVVAFVLTCLLTTGAAQDRPLTAVALSAGGEASITGAGGADPRLGPIVELWSDGSSTYPVLAATEHGVVAVFTTGGESPTAWARRVAVP